MPTFVFVLFRLAGVAASVTGPFGDCESRFESEPQRYESAYCFYQVAQELRLWNEGARRLEALRAANPDNQWLTLARGHIEWTRDVDVAEKFYRTAAEGFADQEEPRGEVLSRYNLRSILHRKGRFEEAGREVNRAVEVAESSGDPTILARALTLQGIHLADLGQLAQAYRSLHRARAVAFPDGTYSMKRGILFALANLCFRMARWSEALDFYQRLEPMAHDAADGITEAAVKYGIVNTRLEQLQILPRPGEREELLRLAEDALKTAISADNREVQVLLYRVIGDLTSAIDTETGLAREYYERCVELARRIEQPRELGHCLWSLGRFLADTDPEKASARIEEALSLAVETGYVWSLAFASRQRMRIAWITEPWETAIRTSVEALDAIEILRELPGEGEESAQVFSAWTRDYHWLSGRILDAHRERSSREYLEKAFELTERMRARLLLDALGSAQARSELPEDHPLVKDRRQIQESIANIHRRRLDPALTQEQRLAAVNDLEELELEERELREKLAEARPRATAYVKPDFATLEQVEDSLAENEAVLSFQVALWEDIYGDFGGGSWLLLSTRQGTRVLPLPDRATLEPKIPVFLGLFERRDGTETAPSVGLYKDLLEEALDGLPAEIDRLILVPDGVLHHLPWGALRAANESEPLAAHFQLTVVPSATLWLRWRQSPKGTAEVPALVFADPVIPHLTSRSEAAQERAGLVDLNAPLGALPYARREARSVLRRLGGSSRRLVGEEASERVIKSTDLREFRILHLAAHAVVDEEHPERSSVLLAPGAEEEDGLLQIREIVDLRLDGQVVALSACRTASGEVLSGEGVKGLARAFFQAGAHTVVGSLWPLRDDDAASIFDTFYRHIGNGASVAEAMREAQRKAIRSGMPAAAWAGLVVLGDGTVTPVPGGRRFRGAGWLVAGGLGITLVFLGFFALRRRRSDE